MSLLDADGNEIIKPGELHIPLQDIEIPEGKALKIDFRLGPYHVFFMLQNEGYHIFEDKYKFKVGYTSIDTRPPSGRSPTLQ